MTFLFGLNETDVEGFLPTHDTRGRSLLTECHSTAIPRKGSRRIDKESIDASKNIEFVDFWGTKICRDDSRDLPADQNLDRHGGELPPGSYLVHGIPEYDPKRTCRVTLALDWNQKGSKFESRPLESSQVVKQIQECVAVGFQTFQLAPECNDVGMIGRVLRETPAFVEMHWVVTLDIPNQISTSTVREAVFDLLSRTQSDSLDTLLVPYRCHLQSQYYLEILDVLQDMRRDGFIRSIGVENWPADLIQAAKACSLSIDIRQRSGNLLLMNPEDMISPSDVTEWWTDPLANNCLSTAFVGRSEPPTHASGWKGIQTWFDLKYSNKKKSYESRKHAADKMLWRVFQEEVHAVLQELSRKYEVSVPTIVLRWELQEKVTARRHLSPSSVIYPLLLVEEPENHLAGKLRELRDVFRFELSHEDLVLLNAIVASPEPKAASLRIDEVDVPLGDIPLDFLREFEAINSLRNDELKSDDDTVSDEYPAINFNNPALWL